MKKWVVWCDRSRCKSEPEPNLYFPNRNSMIIAKTEKKSRHRNISILFRDIAEDSKRINESG